MLKTITNKAYAGQKQTTTRAENLPAKRERERKGLKMCAKMEKSRKLYCMSTN